MDEAHGWGRKVACHAYNGVGLHRALDGGCDSIEHGLELDDAAVAQMVKQGTWYCPTMTPYYDHWEPADTPAGKRDRARAALHGPSLQKAMKAGVKIVFGTDVGGFSWTEPIAQEFKRMAEFGMTPADAIRSATVSAAEMLGMAGEIGVIAPGAYADIVAVPGDPLADLGAARARLLRDEGRPRLQGRERPALIRRRGRAPPRGSEGAAARVLLPDDAGLRPAVAEPGAARHLERRHQGRERDQHRQVALEGGAEARALPGVDVDHLQPHDATSRTSGRRIRPGTASRQ